MTRPARRGRQPLVAARRRPRRPPARRGGPRDRSPPRSAPGRARSSSPAAAPRATTSRSRASTGRAAARTRAGAGSWPARSSTTRCMDAVLWLAEHEGADGRVAAGRRGRPGQPRDARGRDRRATPTSVAAGHRHVGQQRGRHGAADRRARRGGAARTASRSTPTRCRRVGQLPVDFAASGLDAMTVTGHKIGGPLGVGALLLGRDAGPDAGAARRRPGARRPVRHPRHPGDRRPRGRRRARGASARRSSAERLAGAARRPGAPGSRGRAGRRPQRRPRPVARAPAAGQRALLLPRLRGRRAAAAARRAAASSAPPGRPARPGCRSPATCCSRWASPETLARGSLRFSLGHTSTAADVDAVVAAIGPVVERARRAGQTGG